MCTVLNSILADKLHEGWECCSATDKYLLNLYTFVYNTYTCGARHTGFTIRFDGHTRVHAIPIDWQGAGQAWQELERDLLSG